MSNWSSSQLTSLGQALEAKVTAGTTTLVFTKMKLGSGNTTPGDIAAMTDLTAPEMVLGISSCAVSEADSTVCEVVAVASSSDVVSSFAVRETGLFATDPDEGEILYAVSIDTVPDTMPNNTVASPVTVSYQMDIIAANAANVTAIINPAGLVTTSILQAHNDSISAHKMSHWYRQNSKVYAVGDIAFSASLPSSLVLECTTPGTTAATEPDFSGAAEGGTVTDGTVEWTYKGLLSDDGANTDLSNLTATGEARFAHVVVDSYYDSTTGDWWRQYADGWIEQGGKITSPSSYGVNVSYLKPLALPAFSVSVSIDDSNAPAGSSANGSAAYNSSTTTGIKIVFDEIGGGITTPVAMLWSIAGQGASA